MTGNKDLTLFFDGTRTVPRRPASRVVGRGESPQPFVFASRRSRGRPSLTFHPPFIIATSESQNPQVWTRQASSTEAPDFEVDKVIGAVEARLTELKKLAEEEGTAILPYSAAAVLRFLRAARATRAPMISLRDDGSYRAHWREQAQPQVGLSFRDDALIDFVILQDVTSPSGEKIYGAAGHSAVTKIIAAICPEVLRGYASGL